MSLREHQSFETHHSVRNAPFLALWRAKVSAYDRAFFQVTSTSPSPPVFAAILTRQLQPTNDDDEVYLLQLEKNSSLKNLYATPRSCCLII
jgi:hypothetical protein